MNDKIDKAMELHKQGYNCAQSVALPFCEEVGADPQLIKQAAEGFGAGMGNRCQTCGALSGAILIAGLKHADSHDPSSKKATYAICSRMSEQFVTVCGSGICAEIKGESTGTVLCSCNECIRCGVRLAMEALNE